MTSRLDHDVPGRNAQQRDVGAAMVELVLASAIVMILVVAIMQVIVFQYGKGAVHAALDEAARSAARSSTSVETCQARAADALADLLGGPMGQGVAVTCTESAGRVTVSADVHFDGWFGSLSDYDATLTASASREDR